MIGLDLGGALADGEARPATGVLEDLSSSGPDLTTDQERDDDLVVAGEVVVADRHVVLVAAVRIVRRVGVVLEEEDVAIYPLLPEAILGAGCQLFKDPLAGLVMCDDVSHRVALRRGVLGMGPDIEVEAGPVHKEDVRTAAPRDHPSKQVPGDLVRAETTGPVHGACDPVFVLESVYPTVHGQGLIDAGV